MGQLVIASKWIRQRFEKGSRPKVEMVKQWVEAGEIPGQLIAGYVYVDADAAILPKVTRRQRLEAIDLFA